jgi:protein SCO1/2
MKRTPQLVAVALLFIGVTGGAIILSYAVKGPMPAPVRATVLPEVMPLPDFSLVDQHGEAFGRNELAGRWHLLFFGFTHCPDICPATLQQLAIARNRTVSEGREFPGIVLVSVDPERDTPETLAAYVGNFGEDVTGLTGTVDSLTGLTKPLGIYFAKSGDPDGEYTMDHSSVVLLIDDRANWRAVFSAPHDVESFAGDTRLLMDAG